jgi:Rrf2 family protein
VLRVSATVDYALRAAIVMAREPGRPRRATELADSEGLPLRFLATTLASMRRGGILESRRGGTGGFWLSRPPEQISVADLIRAVDGAVVDLRAVDDSLTGPWWHHTAVSIEASLSATSLADLAGLVTPEGTPSPA